MSIMYCEKHDRRWDSDWLEVCPACENTEEPAMTPPNPPDVPTLIADLTCAGNGGYTPAYLRVLCSRASLELAAANLAAEELATALQAYADLPFAIGEAARTALAAYRNRGTI